MQTLGIFLYLVSFQRNDRLFKPAERGIRHLAFSYFQIYFESYFLLGLLKNSLDFPKNRRKQGKEILLPRKVSSFYQHRWSDLRKVFISIFLNTYTYTHIHAHTQPQISLLLVMLIRRNIWISVSPSAKYGNFYKNLPNLF